MKSILHLILLSILFTLSRMIVTAQDVDIVSGIVTTFGQYGLNDAKIIASKSGETAATDSSGFYSIRCNKRDMLKVSAAYCSPDNH